MKTWKIIVCLITLIGLSNMVFGQENVKFEQGDVKFREGKVRFEEGITATSNCKKKCDSEGLKSLGYTYEIKNDACCDCKTNKPLSSADCRKVKQLICDSLKLTCCSSECIRASIDDAQSVLVVTNPIGDDLLEVKNGSGSIFRIVDLLGFDRSRFIMFNSIVTIQVRDKNNQKKGEEIKVNGTTEFINKYEIKDLSIGDEIEIKFDDLARGYYYYIGY